MILTKLCHASSQIPIKYSIFKSFLSFSKNFIPRKHYSFSNNQSQIFRIALTGGSCSGKTIGMYHIADRLRERGVRVYCVPEAATLIANGGGFINSYHLNMDGQVKLQTVISRLVIDLEDRFYQLACGENGLSVILCDRGIMDGKAYCLSEVWEVILEENKWNVVDLRDKRYDGVLHLVTTAEGCPQFYSKLTNNARFENAEQAKENDRKIREAWSGHSNVKIVDNRYDFDEKLNRALNFVLGIIGLDGMVPINYKKYRLKNSGPNHAPVIPNCIPYEKFEIEDTILLSNDPSVISYLRKKTQGGNSFYMHIKKSRRKMDPDKIQHYSNDSKTQISARDYFHLLASRDLAWKNLRKIGYSLVWKGQYIYIQSYENVKEPFTIIYLDASIDINNFDLPNFLQIDEEVSEDLCYSSYELSKDFYQFS